ncbi:hypothetical protein EFQ99_33820 [Rhizobium vallis]|uniref:Uncharacterized protein n=2 Tax=Rhizobium TaxID=379 RepID=A0A2A6J2U2_9HYPH|nr:hypothetical protein CO650_30025 [Rhizobium phaseoli]PDT00177.1 hypothetical protein CO666_32025 [Rhizobium chutanense]RUM17781.1 hypothetical protein EFQ99_33820 [Rhizobium vallis]
MWFLADLSLFRLPFTLARGGQASQTNSRFPSTLKDEFELSGTVLRELAKGRVVLYREEADLRMPATYANEFLSGLDALFDATTFVESGPRFPVRFPFRFRQDVEMSDPPPITTI